MGFRSCQHEDPRRARRQRLAHQRQQDVITSGPVADLAIVWAQTEDGIQGFVLEKGMAGFSTQEIKHKMSLRASLTGALYFDDVRVPDSHRLPNVKGLKGTAGLPDPGPLWHQLGPDRRGHRLPG